MLRTRALALTAAALLLTGCSGSSDESPESDSDTSVEPATPAGPATAGAETGDLLIAGTITDGGQPVTDAQVYAVIWPLDDTDADNSITESYDSPTITTNEDGSFAVELDAASIPPEYFGGTKLAFSLAAVNDAYDAELETTAFLIGRGPGAVWRTEQASSADDSVATVTIDLGAATASLTDSAGGSAPADILVDKD